jgi:hypothetical protein
LISLGYPSARQPIVELELELGIGIGSRSFHNTLTVRDLPRVFMGSSSSTVTRNKAAPALWLSVSAIVSLIGTLLAGRSEKAKSAIAIA